MCAVAASRELSSAQSDHFVAQGYLLFPPQIDGRRAFVLAFYQSSATFRYKAQDAFWGLDQFFTHIETLAHYITRFTNVAGPIEIAIGQRELRKIMRGG